MLRAPRYMLVNGTPQFRGSCGDDWWIALMSQFTASTTFHAFVEKALPGPGKADIDLFVAILVQTGKLAREKYGAPTVILYMPPDDPGYLASSGLTDADIMRAPRNGGLLVLDTTLHAQDFPGRPLAIPGDGHPTATANKARAELLRAGVAGELGLNR